MSEQHGARTPRRHRAGERRELRDRRTHEVVELISRRNELVGINPWADQVLESVAWTA